MTQLRVLQIRTKLKGLFEASLDLSDVGEGDRERDNKVLSRCLAAHAIFMEADCSAEIAAAAVWDGSDDDGIDAVYVEPEDGRVLVVQSKWINAGTGEPSAADVATFANGVRDLIEANSANFHARLQARFADASQAILSPGATIEIILISTGSSDLARHATANLDRIVGELNGPADQEPIASVKVLGLEEVYANLASATMSEKITVEATITDWSYVAHPYPAYFGVIDGLQLKSWWLANGKRLVAKNIRHALGATDVNDGIKATASGAPENFWYFNNGITLIADEHLRAPVAAASRAAGNFQFRGASIVNGAQTVSTLARVDTDEALGRVRVPIRVILLKEAPVGFGGEVTRTNNLQNRVEGRDFVAQDPEQRRLQQEMSLEGVEYQFLRSDDLVRSSHACELLEVTTALACASGDPMLAVQVKTGIGRFFADLKRAPYKTIFNSASSGARSFNSTLVQRDIDEWIEWKKESLDKRSGYAWGLLIHGNRVLSSGVFSLLGSSALILPIEDFRSAKAGLDIRSKCERFYEELLSVLESEFPGKFLAVLFKSPAASKEAFDKALVKARR